MVDIIEQMRELLTIRDRKIELQAKEIELLKKLLALQTPIRKPVVESSWCTEMSADRASLETDEYPNLYYDDRMEKKDA
jgi:hypothetical protein